MAGLGWIALFCYFLFVGSLGPSNRGVQFLFEAEGHGVSGVSMCDCACRRGVNSDWSVLGLWCEISEDLAGYHVGIPSDLAARL